MVSVLHSTGNSLSQRSWPPVRAALRSATPALYFLEFDELLGNEELALELGFVDFELLDARVLGVP